MNRSEMDAAIALVWSDFLAGQQNHLAVYGKYKQFLRGEIMNADGFAIPDVACHEMQRTGNYRAFVMVAIAQENGQGFAKQWLVENGGNPSISEWVEYDE